ncbi:hypothetical protein NXC12_PB00084 (plasmid) [Rhizobium etli]|uniref:Bacterial toxin 28 domain-containing protein n=1 Tax=Rhizobium etli TaxID=29449 RepID=A0AAN1BK18_RHIET|nr:polymorphic toxin type 28 domain-containing protein [Rhizobium etli]ARQ12488.1 hypothetical protein NXC12_PB00084 [Rhizobium etli]
MDPLDSIDGDTDDDGKPDFLDPHTSTIAKFYTLPYYEQTQNGDGLLPTQRSAVERIDNRIEEALNEAHFDAVRRERMGQVVAMNPKTGKPYDHIKEVSENLGGQIKDSRRFARRGVRTQLFSLGNACR